MWHKVNVGIETLNLLDFRLRLSLFPVFLLLFMAFDKSLFQIVEVLVVVVLFVRVDIVLWYIRRLPAIVDYGVVSLLQLYELLKPEIVASVSIGQPVDGELFHH